MGQFWALRFRFHGWKHQHLADVARASEHHHHPSGKEEEETRTESTTHEAKMNGNERDRNPQMSFF
jgi:hypothetical protein